MRHECHFQVWEIIFNHIYVNLLDGWPWKLFFHECEVWLIHEANFLSLILDWHPEYGIYLPNLPYEFQDEPRLSIAPSNTAYSFYGSHRKELQSHGFFKRLKSKSRCSPELIEMEPISRVRRTWPALEPPSLQDAKSYPSRSMQVHFWRIGKPVVKFILITSQ